MPPQASCSVLVVSCDSYQDLWTPFFKLFWRYWPDCPFPVYLGSNFEKHSDARVSSLKAGEDRSWSWNLRAFLEQLDSRYVLLLLEDFFLDKHVSSGNIDHLLKTLDDLGGTAMRLFPQPGPDATLEGCEGIGKIDKRARYRVSAQPALWNRDGLLRLLRNGESAWQFELNGTERSRSYAGFYGTYEPVVIYRHVVERGQWFWSAAKHYRGEDIGCDFGARPVMGPATAFKKAINRCRKHLLEAIAPSSSDLAGHEEGTARLAFLTNFIPPYRRPLLLGLAKEFQNMRVLVSTPMEGNRPWTPDWSGLDVRLQRGLTLRRKWKAFAGEELAVHVPLDTIQQLWKFKPDVVISAEMGVRTLGALIYRRLHPRSRLAVWADVSESTERDRGAMRGCLRRLLRGNADLFFVNGLSGARYLRSIGVGENRICQVPSTVDISKFSNSSVKRCGRVAHRLLFVGQLIERKGLREFLEVLNEWAEANTGRMIEWLLAGDGPLRQELEQAHHAANLRMSFLGAVSYEEMPNVYAEAGSFVMPTLADAWGMAVNEAMAAGLPVLGSLYSQAVEELVQDGVSGWLFRSDRREEMMRALDRCMQTTEEQLNGMRVAAREAASRLTPELAAGMMARAVERSLCVETCESKAVQRWPRTLHRNASK